MCVCVCVYRRVFVLCGVSFCRCFGVLVPASRGFIFAAARRGTARTLRLFFATPHLARRVSSFCVLPECSGGQVIMCESFTALVLSTIGTVTFRFCYLIATSSKLVLSQAMIFTFSVPSIHLCIPPLVAGGGKWASSPWSVMFSAGRKKLGNALPKL